MIKIPERKISKQGNAFHLMIPKALVHCNALQTTNLYDVYVVPKGTKLVEEKEKNAVYGIYSRRFYAEAC